MYVYSVWRRKIQCDWDLCPFYTCSWRTSKINFVFVCSVMTNVVLDWDYNHHFKLIPGWGRSKQLWRAAWKWRPGFMWLRLPVTVCKCTQVSLNWGSLVTWIAKWGRKQFINVAYNTLKKNEEAEKTFESWNRKLSRKRSLLSLTIRIQKHYFFLEFIFCSILSII